MGTVRHTRTRNRYRVGVRWSRDCVYVWLNSWFSIGFMSKARLVPTRPETRGCRPTGCMLKSKVSPHETGELVAFDRVHVGRGGGGWRWGCVLSVAKRHAF